MEGVRRTTEAISIKNPGGFPGTMKVLFFAFYHPDFHRWFQNSTESIPHLLIIHSELPKGTGLVDFNDQLGFTPSPEDQINIPQNIILSMKFS